MTRTALRAVGLIAAVQALLRIGPLVIQAAGGGGLPVPGSFNDPAQALTIIRQSPEVTIVAGIICATGVAQAIIVHGLASWLAGTAPQLARVSVSFGIIAAAFLMIDGALGIAALPQLARLNVHASAADGAYLAILAIRNGIDRAIPLTLGIWALATNAPAWRDRLLPRTLALTGLLLGLAGVTGAILPAAGIASLILALLWTSGLAIVLLTSNGTLPSPQRTDRNVNTTE